MAYSLRDIIKQRVGEVTATQIHPTIYKFNEEDEWIQSNDIVRIGIVGTNVDNQEKVTDTLPVCCFIKQVGSNVTEVHHILVEDGIIPPNIFKYAVNVTDFSNCFRTLSVFYMCNKIKEIPQGLFDNCRNVLSFNSTFCMLDELKSIPENLFANNTKVTDFSACFSYCESIEEIPENLFANNVNAKTFSSCFVKCTSLINIPVNLFVNNKKATDFSYCFYYCENIVEIPIEIFAKLNYRTLNIRKAFDVDNIGKCAVNKQEFLDRYNLTE